MWVCMCISVGVRGGGLEGYVFCCNNLYHGFQKIRYVCFIISLNAFDVATKFFFTFLIVFNET